MAIVPITNLRGPAARISQVTAEAVPADQPAEVVMTGLDQDRKFHFKNPRGLPGVNAVENDTAVAAYIDTVDSATSVAIRARVGQTTSLFVSHGDDANFPRPATGSTVIWMGRVRPVGMIDGDVYLLASAPPEPTVAWLIDLTASKLALASGAAVASWTDASGNGTHATQATGTRQPVFRKVGDAPAYVEFDGVDDYLSTVTLATKAQPFTMVVAFRQRSAASSANKAIVYSKPGAITALTQKFTDSKHAMYAGSFGDSSVVVSLNAWHVAVLTFNGVNSTIRIDGNENLVSAGVNGFNGLTLAADTTGGANADVDLSIVRVFDGILTTPDRDALESWIAYNHGISLG